MSGRSRGKRGAGSKQRRQIQRAAEERQRVWLRNDTPQPVRMRVAQLTDELDELFAAKRDEKSHTRPTHHHHDVH